MTPAPSRLGRHFRHILLGCALTAILLVSYSHDFGGAPLINEIGLEAFLEQQQTLLDAAGTIKHQPYTVPAQFGPGTRAAMSSKLFPELVLGHVFHPLPLNKSALVTRPGDPPAVKMNGEAFNPAIMKMPCGVKEGWEYIVVARGPRVERRDIWVPEAERYAEEHGLVAFPAALTNNGFIPSGASPPRFLAITTSRNNTSCGHWTFPFGPEDPRLYWTDDHRPAMSMSMNAGDRSRCRSVGYVEDLRDVWEELGDAMSGMDEDVAKRWERKESGEWQGVKELRHQFMPNIEKNWMGFFPGSSQDAHQTVPTFHHSLVPARILHRPTHATIHAEDASILFYTLVEPRHSRVSCVAEKLRTDVPNSGHIHHATPLYRLTLCARGARRCVPDAENTVMIGVGQVKVVHPMGQRYQRFFVLWNVTEPFEYLAVGPLFRWHDTPDADIVYAMSLVFVPAPDPNPYIAGIRHKRERTYGPTHGFIDDEVFVTLGLRDNEMATVKLSAAEMLYGMSVC